MLLVGVGINFSHANYVHQKSPNEFDIDLEEQGVRITQKIRFENGLIITEVPDHHNISSGTFVFDEKMGLKLDVVNATQSCYVYIPFFTIGKFEENNLKELANEVESKNEELLEVRPEYTMDLELMSVIGPELDIEDLPEHLQKYCHQGFRVFSKKELPADSNNIRESNNYGDVLLDHPLFKQDAKFGDPVHDFSELFQVLPPSNRSKRVKRECRNENFALVENCFIRDVTCPFGCARNDQYYDCKNAVYNCFYTFMCSTIIPGEKCLWHTRDSKYSCQPCCANKNCGEHLPRCQGMS